MKKLKQGQTVYILEYSHRYMPPRAKLIKVFLHSQKTKLPPEGCFINKWPVNFVQKMVDSALLPIIYSSRRKAERILLGVINNG